ncbi:hypothetical protein HanXRQr2_Chr06g0272731 [Helianthus annuus]|uniref:Uncharacterized protein n=1 Tax=Helianthus annuus TaxID=4232 RepID=A0A251SQJ0_HELAN|nr:hypothetical protein HanXRQr2_Chr06g0272731 [Helianthus annuus]KAJ0916567.1 hypothetical protein HanPSC8_Chr06g0263261 [Helianthus annuus]
MKLATTIMASNPQRSDVRSTDDYGSELNTSSTVELAAISDLTRGAAGELTVIRTLRRLIGPVFVPHFRPLICQLVSSLSVYSVHLSILHLMCKLSEC